MNIEYLGNDEEYIVRNMVEKDLSQEEPEEIEGIYIVTQRDSWDVVTLRYHDGEEKELLYYQRR